MQKSLFRIFYILFLLFLFNSCATKVKSVYEIPHYEEIPYERGPYVISPTEQLIQRIKLNGSDMGKYFILDDKGFPVVKADIINENGSFEIVYDLENAEPFGNNARQADASYNVPFTVREKDSEIVLTESNLIWRPVRKKAGLLLSMDDKYIENWEYFFELLDKYSARMTFFIQGEFTSFSNRAINRGHDVGYHSLNHLDLREMSREELINEVIKPLDNFKNQGVPLFSFAFPYGFSNARIREILSESFMILRGYGTTFRIYSENDIRSGYIISKAIDNIVIPNETDYNRLIILMLRTLKFLDDDWVLPLTTHDISDSAPWGITPKRLEFLLKTAVDLNLLFYRYIDFVNLK